jgi:hypothetical protein
VLTLVGRTLGRVAVLMAALVALLVAFQVSIVAVAASLFETQAFDRIAGLLPAVLAEGLGPAVTSFSGMAALGFLEPLIVMVIVQVAIYLGTEPAADVESRLVDLLLARPLPRHLLITRSLLVMTGAAIGLPLVLVVSMYVTNSGECLTISRPAPSV